MNTKCFAAVLLAFGCTSALVLGSPGYVTGITYTIGQAIPDNNPSGLASTQNFSAPGAFGILDLDVTLNISGGFNGDYYAYLSHGTGFSVLLNRVGRDGGNAFGYGDSGLNVTLDDTALNGDIHEYHLTLNPNGSALTGTFAPDGRTEDPGTVTTASPRLTDLSSFNGIDPNGQWTLFIVDLDPGSTGTLQSWGLSAIVIPEPATASLLLLGSAGLIFARKRARKA